MDIYLIRHAKSSWHFDLDDFHRPLNHRGRRDVLRMGAFLKDHLPKPDQMVSSPASRAFYTALFLADFWKYPEERIRLDASLYHATPLEIRKACTSFSQGPVALFGHNPGFTQFIEDETGEYIENLPTCGVAHLRHEEPDSFKLVGLFKPKELP